MARDAYWKECQEAIRNGILREVPEYQAIEVLAPVQIGVGWKKRVRVKRKGQPERVVWREQTGLIEYLPGQVLHREWRLASDWEIEEWRNLPEEKLKELGVFRKDGEFSIQIVEKIKDLPAAIRQRGRHIPARKIARQRKKFVLAGDSRILQNYSQRLSQLLQDFLGVLKPEPQLMEKTSLELIEISQLLEGSRTSLKQRALLEIQLASQGRFWEIPARTSQALTNLLNQRIKDYEIAMSSIKLAEKWLDLMAEIERKFRHCYQRLGKLGEELQGFLVSGKPVPASNLIAIANEAFGVWKHLTENVPKFNPYYSRLQEPEFQRLSRVKIHAEASRAKTVFNDLEEAAAKLEAVAIREKPSRVELEKEKAALF